MRERERERERQRERQRERDRQRERERERESCNLTSAVETITKRSSYTDCYWCGYCNK